jgi:hypothetical protein
MPLLCPKCGRDLEEKLYEGDFLELWQVENITRVGARAWRARFLDTGLLPYYVFGVNDIRIKRTDLNAFLETLRARKGVFEDGRSVTVVMQEEAVRRKMEALRHELDQLERMVELCNKEREV